MIPIFRNHDHQKVIGSIETHPNFLAVRFLEPISRDELFEMMGGAGVRVLDQEIRVNEQTGAQTIYIRSAEILEFSVMPPGVKR